MNPQTFDAIKARFKKPGLDVTLDTAFKSYKYVSIKMDGWWSVLEVADGVASVYSVSGSVVHKYAVSPKVPPVILIGEYMFGTNRALSNDQRYMSYHVFDIYDSSTRYIDRYMKAQLAVSTLLRLSEMDNLAPPIQMIGIESIVFLPYYLDLMKQHNHEGLVFRTDEDLPRLPRYKPLFTQDYICVGFNEGTGKYEGTLGSIQGAKYIDNRLVKVINVGGGFTDAMRYDIWNRQALLIGKVFEAEGRQLFNTGALRHPTFLRWRDDVDVKEVVWPKP